MQTGVVCVAEGRIVKADIFAVVSFIEIFHFTYNVRNKYGDAAF